VTVNGVTYTDGDGNLLDNTDGTWDLAIPVPLPDALYQVVATLTDAAGNTSTDPGSNELLIDTIAPASPGVTSRTTNITSPVIEGTAIVNAGETLTVTVNGISYTAGNGNLVDNTDSTWTLAIPVADALAEGTYEVTATITDNAGNSTSDPSIDELWIDTTAPVAPAVDAQITNNTAPTLTGTAIVANGETLTVTIDGVTYTTGDGNLVDNGDGTWTLAIPATNALAEGVLEVTVTVTDAAGNSSSDISSTELTVDLTPPAVPTVVSLLTNNVSPVINGTASLTSSDTLAVLVNSITYTAGDGNLLDNTDGTWTLTIPASDTLLENTFDVIATITDSAANTSDDITTNELIVDLTPPTAPGVTSLTTANPTPVISGTTAIGTGTLLQVTVNGVTYAAGDGDLIDNLDGTWDLAIPASNGLADALYEVVATLTDMAGNTSTDPGSNELLVDTTAPVSPGVTSLTTNLTSPVIEGTAIVNASETLTVTVNGIVYSAGDGNLVDNTDGTWTLAVPTANALPESIYEVTATVTDAAGNSTSDPSIDELLIDTTAPVSPAADTQVTNNTAPTITGNATIGPGETLTVTVDGVTYTDGDGNLVDNTDGTWSLTIPVANALVNSTYDVAVTVTDAAGNSSSDVTIGELIIDTQPLPAPMIVITEDSNDDGLISSAEPSDLVDLTVTIPLDAVAGDVIQVSDGSVTLLATLTPVDLATGSITFTLPAGIDGAQLTVNVTIMDTAGNVSVPGNDTAIFDFTPPSAPQAIISEDSNDDGFINIAENTANNVSDVDLTFTLPLDASAGDTLTWSVNGGTTSIVLSGVNIVAGIVNITTPDTFADTDTITLLAQLIDVAGNQSGIGTDSATYDLTMPPAVAVTTQITNTLTPVIMGTATVDPGDNLTVVVNSVSYSAGDGNLVDNGDATWSLTIPAVNALSETVFDVTVYVTDNAGNITTDVSTSELTVDLTPPAIPAVNTLVTNNPLPTISGTATVAAGDTLSVTVDATSYIAGDGNLTDNNDGTWTLVFPTANALVEGVYDVAVTLTDLAGNSNADVSVDELTVDLTAPAVPTVVALVTNNINPVINGTATLTTGDTLAVMVNGITYNAGDGNLIDNADGTWTLTIPAAEALTENTFEVTATVTDIAANSSNDITSSELIVDLTPPPAPGVTSQTTANPTPVISGTTAIGSGLVLQVTVNDVTYTASDGNLVDNNDGTWDLTIPAANTLPDALYQVVATLTDTAANTSTDPGSNELLVDTTAPPSPGVTSLTTNLTSPVIEGTANVNAGETLTVTVNGITYTAGDGTLIDNNNGTWMLAIPIADALAENTYEVTATVTDSAGNSTSDPSVDELLIDTTAPVSPAVDAQATNITSPTITGTATVGATETLIVLVNGLTYTDADSNLVDNNDGTWTLVIPAVNVLAEGVFDVTAIVTDAAGNTSSDVTIAELTVDLTPPALPTVLSLSTNNVNPTITGTASVGTSDTLTVTVNGVPYTAGDGNLIDNADGTWTLTIPAADALAESILDVDVTVTDAAGNNNSDNSNNELTIDLTAPAVPTIEAQITNIANPIINGTAALAAGDVLTVAVDGVTYTAGDGNLVDNNDGTWTLSIPAADAVAENTYDVDATNTDSVGNSATDTSFAELIVDQTPPPAPGVTSQTTTNPTPVISGTTTIGTGLVLQVIVNGVTYTAGDGNLVDNNDGTWNLTLPASDTLPDSLYQVIATLTDPAGNTSTDPGSNELLVDTTAPLSPGVTSLTTNLTSPVIEGTATVNAGETLTVTVNGITYTAGEGNLVDNNDGSWTLTIPAIDALAENTYEVTATVTDSAGNTTSDPSINELLVDTTAPVVPTVDTLITNKTLPVITGTATVGTGETLTVVADGVSYTDGDANLVDNTDGTWSLAIPVANALAENIYDVKAIVTDPAGNTSSDFTINELTVDLTAPAVPTVATLLTNIKTPVVNGTATVLAGEILSVSVDGITYTSGDGNLVDNANGTWTLTIPAANALTDNLYNVAATVIDIAGNTSSDSSTNELTVDLTAPAAPTVLSLSTNNASPTITGTAATGTGDLLTVTVNGISYTAGDGNLVDNADGTWTLTIPATDALVESILDVDVTVTDSAGNSNTDVTSSELTIDLTAPSAPSVVALLTNNVNPVLTGTAALATGDSLTITVDGTTYTAGDGNLVDNNDGTWTLSIPSALIENTFDVDATITDQVGNSANDITDAELIVDLTPPPAPGVTSMSSQTGTPLIAGTSVVIPDTVLTVTVNGIIYTAGDGKLLVNSDGTWTLAIPPAASLHDGLYGIIATLTDLAGNQSSDPGMDELLIDSVSPITPGVTSLTTNLTEPVLHGTAIVASGETLVVNVNGVDYTAGDSQLTLITPNLWMLQIPAQHTLPEGNYDVTAVVRDSAGNTGVDPSSGELLIDTTAPDAATIVSQITNDTTPLITGLAFTDSGDTLTVAVDGVTYTAGDGILIDNGDGGWQLALPTALPDGIYSVLVSVTDAAGNKIESAGSLLIDTVDPTIEVEPTGVADTETPALNGTSDLADGAIVVVTNENGDAVCNATVMQNTWQCIPVDSLNFGANSLSATATDAAGNVAQIDFEVPIDTDFDNDGIDNSVEGNGDFDGDGIADLHDLDTDNDGIPDSIEGNIDSDNDGVPNFRDRDTDNDGIADVVEAGGIDSDSNFALDTLTDTDNNGLADAVQSSPLALTDTDFDGIEDYIDVDSDQDGIPDLVELGGLDADNDGRIDEVQDNNADGIDDAIGVLPFEIPFSDNDDLADHLDLDSDQDGTFDLVEASGSDMNNDGIVDSMTDADKDSIPDSADVTFTLGADIDGDGIDDTMDASQLAPQNDSSNSTSEFLLSDSTNNIDADNDGIADQFDPDSNGDGYADTIIIALAIGMALPDSDNNGTPDFQQAKAGVVLTGLKGHPGCSISTEAPIDPLFAMMFVFAMLCLKRRSFGKR